MQVGDGPNPGSGRWAAPIRVRLKNFKGVPRPCHASEQGGAFFLALRSQPTSTRTHFRRYFRSNRILNDDRDDNTEPTVIILFTPKHTIGKSSVNADRSSATIRFGRASPFFASRPFGISSRPLALSNSMAISLPSWEPMYTMFPATGG